MSQKKTKDAMPQVASWDYGVVLSTHTPDQIVGRVLTIIEAAGLQAQQENSIKQLIRQAVWEVFSDGVSITPERHTEIRELHYEMKRKQAESGLPPKAI